MAQVIMLQDALRARARLESHPPKDPAIVPALPPASFKQPSKQDVDRALLFLDIAARHTRLLVMKVDDPSSRENLELQIAAIEQLLQIAKHKALQL